MDDEELLAKIEEFLNRASLEVLLALRERIEKKIRLMKLNELAYGFEFELAFRGNIISGFPPEAKELMLEQFLQDLTEASEERVKNLLAANDYKLIEELSNFFDNVKTYFFFLEKGILVLKACSFYRKKIQ